MDQRLVAFQRLLDIMDDLREKCPWDKKQTLETLRPLTIEETYEQGLAFMSGNTENPDFFVLPHLSIDLNKIEKNKDLSDAEQLRRWEELNRE